MSLDYRAIFTDPDDTTKDRPDQIFASNYRELETWAAQKLAAGGPNSYVELYQTSETRIAFRRKPKEANAQ